MMKKLWSAVLVLCMILAVMTVSAFAADVPVRASGSHVTFTVKADKAEVRPGDTITFSVYISEVENLAGALFTLSIPEGLTFVKGSSSVPAYLKDEYDFGEASFSEKTMLFIGVPNTSFSSMTETKLLSFQCTVNENAPETMTLGLTINVGDVFDYDYNDLPFTIIGATVTSQFSNPNPNPNSNVVFTVTADKTEAVSGDTITFSVYISEVENLAGAGFTLSFPEGLTFVKGSSSVPAYLKDEYNFWEASFAEKTMAFVVSHSTSFSSITETKLLSFQCTVNENAPETMTLGLTINVGDVFDDDYNDLPFTIIGATVVNYHEYIYGFCVDCGGYEPAVLNGDVYEISNAGQLYWFAAQVNGGKTSINGKLMADIVVNENVLNADGTLNGDGSNFRVWTPIGNDVKNYSGTFDGNGKTVSGLYFKDAEKNYVGLFGYVFIGCVKNVGVEDSYLSGNKSVGGVVGFSNYGTVSDCYNTGSVSGSGRVGGVVGSNGFTTVSNCYNTGSVSGDEYVGGVAGTNAAIVSNSYNTGSVSGSKYVGGVAGKNDAWAAIVSNSNNTGSVSGDEYVGGVVGFNYGSIDGNATVVNCYNIGSVTGGNYVGGVVGFNSINSTVSNCYNAGSVSGSSYVGGVVGYNSNYGTVSNCYYLEGCVSKNNGYGISKTAQQFASGEVAYLLQGDQTEQVWGQLIGAEPYPVLGGEKVYADNGSYYNLCDHYWDGGSCTEGVNCFICGAVSSYFPGHQWQDATCDQPKTCSVCGTTEGEAQGHSYEGVVTEPDCTHAGFTTYTCTACGDSYYEDFVAPLGHETYSYSFANGVHSLTCSLCGVTENMTSTDGKQFKFNTASPALAVDIVMNIAVTLPAGFTNPYMVVEFNGTTTTLNDYTIDQSNGRCVFAFPGINPQVMGDTFVATLYADVDAVQVTVELEYSMLKYINSQLKKSTISDALRTALSDLVMYGEANQVYEGYKTDALLSSLLEDAAKENLTPSTFVNLDAGYNQMAITGTAHSSIDLKGVTMALGSKVIVRMTVYCADPSAYTVKVTINGEDHLYPVSKLPLAAGYTDRYVLEFDQIRATQFGEVITFSFLDADGNQLGRTLTYSVYTYVQKNQGSANANLANLLKAIYNYGESVKNI